VVALLFTGVLAFQAYRAEDSTTTAVVDGAVVTRFDLMNSVWSYQADVSSRTVDTHIAELRRKLEDNPSQPQYILTVRKAGYRLQS
jgi:DNA-binding response OmpR family regulator